MKTKRNAEWLNEQERGAKLLEIKGEIAASTYDADGRKLAVAAIRAVKDCFTFPSTRSNQDFDECQQRAAELTDADRAAGRPAPACGYSRENFARAQAEYRAAVAAFYGGGR